MAIYEVTNECYFKDEKKVPGDTIELDDEGHERAYKAGVVGKNPVGASEPQDPDIDGLKKLGGGYYELPNGDKVRGKEAAEQALEALKAGELNAQNQAGGSAEAGAGEPGSNQVAAEN